MYTVSLNIKPFFLDLEQISHSTGFGGDKCKQMGANTQDTVALKQWFLLTDTCSDSYRKMVAAAKYKLIIKLLSNAVD